MNLEQLSTFDILCKVIKNIKNPKQKILKTKAELNNSSIRSVG